MKKLPLSGRPKLQRAIIGALIVALGAGAYFYQRSSSATTSNTSSMVVYKVSSGDVSTGITASGKVEAAEVLDLNVYKTASRIDSLNVANGSHVETGALLFAYDQSDVNVSIASNELGIEQAKLAYEVSKSQATDPSTTIATLKNDITVLEQGIAQHREDLRSELRSYLSKDLTAEPSASRYSEQIGETAPAIGGTYNGTAEGAYTVRVYTSREDSGFSYELSGLESGVYPVYLGRETRLGTRGLTITFPTSGVSNRDTWIIAVPNTYAPEYQANRDAHEKAAAAVEEQIKTDTVTLANKRTSLAQAERGDTSAQRNLTVDNAALAIDQARVNLQKSFDTQKERRIIAPFSGTVEGMENVVVGATPTKDSSDPINLGSLISDEFLASFSLSANDADKVSVGQKVLVTLTSVPGSDPLIAEVTEISSLPDSGAVPQYSIRARITNASSSPVRLRQGMLADIEIVQQEKQNVLRVPTSAITYKDGKPTVTMVENLSAEQARQQERLGIIRTDGGTQKTYERAIELGLRGQYYAEVTSGLSEGEYVSVSTVTVSSASNTVVGTGFGGGFHPPNETRTTQSSSRTSTNGSTANTSRGGQ